MSKRGGRGKRENGGEGGVENLARVTETDRLGRWCWGLGGGREGRAAA